MGAHDGTTNQQLGFWNTKCPGWKERTGMDVIHTDVKCVKKVSYQPGPYGCNDKATPPVFEVGVGFNGELWPKLFLYNPNNPNQVEFTYENTQARQCAFYDQSLYEGALQAFYSELAHLTAMPPPNGLGNPYTTSPKYYMETEMNMQTPADQLMKLLQPDLLAIAVQQTPCVKQLAAMKKFDSAEPEKMCHDLEQKQVATLGQWEKDVIENSVKAACHVQGQLQTTMQRKIPVVNAKVPTNGLIQASVVQSALAKTDQGSMYTEIDCSTVQYN